MTNALCYPAYLVCVFLLGVEISPLKVRLLSISLPGKVTEGFIFNIVSLYIKFQAFGHYVHLNSCLKLSIVENHLFHLQFHLHLHFL